MAAAVDVPAAEQGHDLAVAETHTVEDLVRVGVRVGIRGRGTVRVRVRVWG